MVIYSAYTYYIGWSLLNKWYYGVRFAENCKVEDLWTSYFTSSNYVKEFVEKYGNPDVVKIDKIFIDKNAAIEYEHSVLKFLKVSSNKLWLNASIGKCPSRKGKTLTEESKNKIGQAHKGKVVSAETRKKISEKLKGTSKPKSEEHKKKISEVQKGKKRKPLSNELKKKLSEIKKGKKTGPLSEETKLKISAALKNKG